MCDTIGKRGKVKDVEFLEYFTESIINWLSKDEKVSSKQLMKYLSVLASFLNWIHESGTSVNEELLDKIRNIGEFYNEYINRTNVELDKDLKENCIDLVVSKVNEYFPSKASNESLAKYINKISQLEKEIKELRKNLDEVTSIQNGLQTTCEQKTDKINLLNEQVNSLEKEKKQKDKETESLKSTIDDLTSRISELEITAEKSNELSFELEKFKQQCEQLNVEAETLKRKISEYKDKIEQLSSSTKKTKLEELIYHKILLTNMSVADILGYINEQGIQASKDEILASLRKMRSKLNIETSMFSLEPMYRIVKPHIKDEGKFTINIPSGSQYYDIMLVSDFHLKEFDSKVMSGFEILNEYCINNNINLILNLGDFYNGSIGNSIDYDTAIKNYDFLEQSISLLPRAEGIFHAILGGNHDRKLTKYGYDPIKILTDERDDFINLGYTHSVIELKGQTSKIGQFDIHHPDNFDFSIDLTDEGIDSTGINDYLNNIYGRRYRKREDSYIDVFGHTHKSQFNYPESYCYIPSFFEGKNKKGACHLKIYFDEDKEIKYMAFMPLSGTTKLSKNNVIIYKKILTK